MAKQESNRLYVFLIYLTLAISTIVAYEPIRHNDFVEYDDQLYITENPSVTGGITLQSVIWAFTKSHSGNWHPITWLSHMLDCEIYGLNPLGHHITNLLIHIANTLLLFLLLSRMTGAIWPSAFVAAAFALHPIHVESVAWAAERKDVLSGLFWMLTILAYIHYARRPTVKRYTIVLLAFIMALMSKPMVVTLPFVLLLLDYWPLDRLIWRQNATAGPKQKQQSEPATYQKAYVWHLLVEKIPLFVLSAISSIITLISQKQAVAPLELWPFHSRVINALGCYFNYITKMLYPKGLAALYPIPERIALNAAALTVIGTVTLLFLWGRKRRWLVVGLLWYLGTLVPVIGLVQVGNQMMADRYTYLPSIGIFIIIAWAAAEIFAKLPRLKPAVPPVAAAALIAMVLLTRIQVGYWRDSPTLYKRAIDSTKNNFIMLNNYGTSLYAQGKFEQALRHFKEAVRIDPEHLFARQNICFTLLAQNKLDEAISCLTAELLKRNDWPELHKMYYKLGRAYEQKDSLALAKINYQKALRLKPDYEPARSSLKNLGKTFAKQGRLNEAVACFNELLRQKKDSADAHYDLAVALGLQGRYDDSIKHFTRVLKLNPKYPDVHYKIGATLMAAGRFDEAIQYYKEAARINPEYLPAQLNICAVLLAQDKFDEAISCFTEKLQERNDWPEMHKMYYNLGWAYEQKGDLAMAEINYKKALSLKPDFELARNNLESLLAKQGRSPQPPKAEPNSRLP